MTKSIIEKFEEQFGYCFNIGAVPDTITKKNIKQFLLTELQALKEEVGKVSGEYGYEVEEVFKKFGVK
jgi:hypothetical protein